jgi:hypothetical protein
MFLVNTSVQYTCVYKEHKVTVHLCLQGTRNHSTLVFTRNTNFVFLCKNKCTVTLCSLQPQVYCDFMFLANTSALWLYVPCKHKCMLTRNIKSQYSCGYKEHKVTVHLCLQGTQSHSTLVFTQVYCDFVFLVNTSALWLCVPCKHKCTVTSSQYTCCYKEHKITVHLCLQGT